MRRWVWIAAAGVFVLGVVLQITVRRRDDSIQALERLATISELPADWPTLLERVSPPDGLEVGQQVLRTLERLGGADATRVIYRLGRECPELASDAATRLSRIRGRAAAPVLLEIIRDPDAPVDFVAAALRSLGHTRLRQTVDEIISMAADTERDSRVRLAANEALGWIADPRALPTLVTLLESTAPAIRRRAIRSIGRIRAPESLAALEALVNSTTDDNERNLARDALARLRGEPVFRD